MVRLVSCARLLRAALLAWGLSFGMVAGALAQQGPASVAHLARELSDAVVNIGTSRHVGHGAPFPEVPEGSPLEEFFDDLNPNQGLGEDMMREARSLGSGFVISAEGLIVTNNHVVDEADEILVFLPDGKRHVAKIVGADEKTDLAVLKIDAGYPLPFVEFGDSDTAQVGDWVMAIGNPFGLGGSVTLGIVSARNRNINSGPYDNFIQTDAAINQGNSGGPLFDMFGKVVGVNTAIISRSGGGLGIGFAVPGNLAKPVVDQLVAFGETRRGWLGVGIQEVSEDIAITLGREDTQGALVVEVIEASPSVGVMRDGDLILVFDGRPIVTTHDLPRFVAETEVGKQVIVRVLRDGTEQDLEVTIGRLEASEPTLLSDFEAPELQGNPDAEVTEKAGLAALVGLEVEVLDAVQRRELEIAGDVEGLLITNVVEGSHAEREGLLSGLVIEEVNQRAVSDVETLTAIVGTAREEGRPAVLFKVADPTGSRRYVAIRLQ
ncbi:Do family serine endopeptidase [Mariluticola halotolerans]|uniref:Do family serine endopeptidase n=1 Tax=Mariluticola halotolerans TaxID=2909283 RepID=UPI0026E465E7|nr:Do family serine endopeptidase [Mariluticola halotolerans]UJQ94641.1 Do family serine endopeptidase [Mariluticola halotolerans]